MAFDAQTVEGLSNRFAAELDQAGGSLEERVELTVATLSHVFGVSENEVALFHLNKERTLLKFLWPSRLKPVGAIPYSSIDSLAARTAREGAVFLNNTFESQRHASAFEKLRLEPGMAPPPKPIRKLISVPVIKGEEVLGVIQLSRKGDLGGDAISDFSDADATALLALAGVLGARL